MQAARRRRQALALCLLAACFLANIWPLAGLVAQARPLILGLPFALACMLGSIVVSFLTLLWLWRAEGDSPASGERE